MIGIFTAYCLVSMVISHLKCFVTPYRLPQSFENELFVVYFILVLISSSSLFD